jgi:PrtD family type I secretion system ABC transporter
MVEEGLRHLPEAVLGRLSAFLAGRSEPGRLPETSAAQPLPQPGQTEIRAAVEASRKAFVAAGLFSFIINVLMLAGPLFMLQVYDRVVTSGSMPTLVVLTLITVALYIVIGFFELIRTRVIVRAGVEIDQRLGPRIFRASLRRTLSQPGVSSPALRELDNIRQFVSGSGPLTFFDAPWTPVYLLVVFMLHWALGIAAMIGALALVAVAWVSERTAREPLHEANKASAVSVELAESGQRNAEALLAMGMVEAYRERWQQANNQALSWQILATDRLGSTSAVSKTLRLLLQSLMLAVGAALAVAGEISAGSIVAATITFGRALAPVDQAIGHWRSFLKARESYAKLEHLLKTEPEPPQRTALPAPKGLLEVQSLRVATPDTRRLILATLTFSLRPGQMLAVIGPSASGKSTLARALVGLWPPYEGSIKIDGARLDQWDPEALGVHIGYLPQNVELFSGTVRENIARFRPGASDAAVVEAARMAHAHDLILALPNGYDTQLGSFGTYLSAGQRQRIGLARALFGNPALVILDEPNANLDRDGDEALASATDGMRKRGQSIVLISHRVQAIGMADLLLYLDRGAQRAFGPRTEVMKLFQGPGQPRLPGDRDAD